MYLFLILCMPISFYIYVLLDKKDSKFQKGFFYLIGLILASIHLVFDFFLNSSYSNAVFNVRNNYISFLLNPVLIPVLICSFILLLFAKDKIIFKLSNLPSLIIGYFSLFVPFYVITRNQNFDLFLLLLLPLIFVWLVFYFDCAMSLIIKLILKEYKKLTILFVILCILVAIIIPPLFYALYFVDLLIPLLVFLLVLYFALPVLLKFFSEKLLKA